MPKKYDCISIGSATVDVILKSDTFKVVKNQTFETGLAICEMYGSKTEIKDFYVGSGGGSTNSSCSLSNLGLKTSCVSIIGNDSFSDLIYDDLEQFKVDIDNLIIRKGEKTAFSTILTAPDGGRTVLVYRGPCSSICLDDIKNRNLDTSWVYLTNLGLDFANAYKVILYLKKLGIKVFWNPGANELQKIQSDFINNVDVLSLNSEEAELLTNVPMKDTAKQVKALSKLASVDGIILLTIAEKGAFCITRKNIFHVSSYKVIVENTLGAGDAFGSGFLYGYIKGYTLPACLEYAIKNSVSVIQKTGAKEGFLKDLKILPKPIIKTVK